MILTHKIEIKPNKTTINLFNQYFGYSRYIYNKGLATWNEEYESGNKPTGRKVRDLLKADKFEWEKSYSPMVLDSSIEDLERGFKKFFKKQCKHPKFKSKRKSNNSFRSYRKNDSTIRVKDGKIFLPKFPYGIKLTEEIRFNGIIKTCTILKKADKYFASFSIDILDEIKQVKSNKSVGIDLGIKEFAILGYDYKGNRRYKHYKSIIKDLKPLYEKVSHYQRLMSKKCKTSNKYSVMKTKLQRLYLKIANIQKDYLNKISTKVVNKFKYITIEDLSIGNMIKNRKLSKVISRSLFYTFRLMLDYKSKLYGNTLIIADKWFPSTQTCSHCGNIKTDKNKLKLSNRTYTCMKCGIVEDRDENAAYNLKIYGENMLLS